MAFSPDGGRVVTGIDTTVQQWDAREGNAIGQPLSFQKPVEQVAFNARGDRIVSASAQTWVISDSNLISDTNRGRGTLQISDANPDSGLAAELGGSRAAHLGHGNGAFALYVLEEGPRIVVVQQDTLRWLNADTGEQIGPTVVSDALPGIRRLDISPTGSGLQSRGPTTTSGSWTL